MSASRDTTQKIGFYFGNALAEIPHLLPSDEVSFAADEISQLNFRLEALQGQLDRLVQVRSDLRFVLQDIKRLSGSQD